MRKFVLRVVVFLFICSILFLLLDKMVTAGLRKTRQETFDVWNDIFSGTINAETLVSGSSRAWVHVSPYIIDSVLGTNSYNLGFDGTDFEDQYKRYQLYRKYNRKPTHIIQVLDINSFSRRKVLTRHQQLFPYLSDPLVWDMAQKFEGFGGYADYIPFYRYIGQTNFIKIGLFEFFHVKQYKSPKYKGYEPKSKEWDLQEEEMMAQKIKEVEVYSDTANVRLFNEFLNECTKEGVKVTAVLAPEFYTFQKKIAGRNKVIELYKEITERNGHKFVDFSNNPLCYSREFFYNSTHMNKKGAERFTNQLCDSLKTWW